MSRLQSMGPTRFPPGGEPWRTRVPSCSPIQTTRSARPGRYRAKAHRRRPHRRAEVPGTRRSGSSPTGRWRKIRCPDRAEGCGAVLGQVQVDASRWVWLPVSGPAVTAAPRPHDQRGQPRPMPGSGGRVLLARRPGHQTRPPTSPADRRDAEDRGCLA